jgi:hypothetical protein
MWIQYRWRGVSTGGERPVLKPVVASIGYPDPHVGIQQVGKVFETKPPLPSEI